jgi:hypothetical protein
MTPHAPDNTLESTQAELRRLLDLAGQQLGRRCAPFDLDWTLRTALTAAAARPQFVGFGDLPPVRLLNAGKVGHDLLLGMAIYRVRLPERVVPVICVANPQPRGANAPLEDIWLCPEDDMALLYRFLRRASQADYSTAAPLLKDADRQRLWDNTIGFLLKGRDVWQRYRVPLRRGVMLMGEPGNGKTMAARWLRAESIRRGLDWKCVSGEEYDRARQEGEVNSLLELDDTGIVFLDDFDRGVDNRDDSATPRDHSALLSALDGMETRQGAVFVFTSNLTYSELDPAIRRPGRIDAFFTFPRPTADLRRRLVDEYWPAEVRSAIPVNVMIAETEGLSFAEMDELKKLLIVRFLDSGNWDWPWAWHEFTTRAGVARTRSSIGFAAAIRSPAERTTVSA